MLAALVLKARYFGCLERIDLGQFQLNLLVISFAIVITKSANAGVCDYLSQLFFRSNKISPHKVFQSDPKIVKFLDRIFPVPEKTYSGDEFLTQPAFILGQYEANGQKLDYVSERENILVLLGQAMKDGSVTHLPHISIWGSLHSYGKWCRDGRDSSINPFAELVRPYKMGKSLAESEESLNTAINQLLFRFVQTTGSSSEVLRHTLYKKIFIHSRNSEPINSTLLLRFVDELAQLWRLEIKPLSAEGVILDWIVKKAPDF